MITRNLLLLVLQELAVVLITLLPLVSVNISKDERSYISKGLKVPPISKSFICDHFGCIETSVNSAHSSTALRSVNRSDDGTTDGVDWTLKSDLKTCYASSI